MLKEKQELRIPGPVPVPPKVSLATARPMINHRGKDFKQLLPSLLERLKPIFGTTGWVIPLTGSGTAAMEASVVNFVSPKDKVLVLIGGSFGARWAALCRAYGCEVVECLYPWGSGVQEEQIREILEKEEDIKAIFATHNESSTAVLNDLEAITRARGDHQALVIVDAVSSLGGTPFLMDTWGVDVVATASQKCLMVPPGIAFVAYTKRAKERMKEVTTPRFYFNILSYEEQLTTGETPFTPNVSNFFGLDCALDMIEHEGLENIYTRHLLMRDMVRAGIEALGLPLLVEEKYASPTTTAIHPAFPADPFRIFVRDHLGVELAGGQGKLAGKIFRIGHMGYATPLDMLTCLAAIEIAVGKPGVGVGSASAVWAKTIENPGFSV